MCRQDNEYWTNVLVNVHANRTLTVPPFQAVSGSYRMRHLYASARSPEGAAAMFAPHERPTSPLHAVSLQASSSPPARLTRPDNVKAGLTAKRPRRQVENDEYAAFVRRILHAYSRRVGDGDVEALALMLGLAEEIDTAIAKAVTGLRACGYSWAEIGSRLGVTRQAAQQRWAQPDPDGG